MDREDASADDAPCEDPVTDLEHVEADTLETIVLKVGVNGEVAGDGAAAAEAGDTLETPGKTPNRRYQKYRTSWEQIPELKDWLEAVDGDPHTAWCRVCRCGLTCHLKNLMVHAKSTKHQRRSGNQPVSAPAVVLGRRGRGRRLTTSPRSSPATLGRGAARKPAAGTPEPAAATSPLTQTKVERQLEVCYGDADRVNYSIGLHNQTVGFVGAGCIAQATLKGMLDKGIITPGNVVVSAQTNRNLDAWKRWGCSTTLDNAEVVAEADMVVVAVKPQVAEAVFRGLAAALDDGRERCFVSLVTGWSRQRVLQTLTSNLPEAAEQPADFHVIRCVPNLSVSIGEGCSVYSSADGLPHRWMLAVETIFSALGSCQKVDEYLMDVYSGAFSSGTAFVLNFIDALASGAVNLGVPWHDALQMAAKTTSGAAQLVLESGRSPADLRRDASSAGGSALAGIMALQKAGLEYAVMSAVQASSERCTDLGRQPSAESQRCSDLGRQPSAELQKGREPGTQPSDE